VNGASEGQIELITRPEEEDESRGVGVQLVSQAVDVDEIRKQYKKFMRNLQSIIDVGEGRAGPFQLNEVQFNAEISANGEFKLVGTGVGVEAKGAVTFVLRRNHPESQATPG
jgi:hypothetical protein